MSSAAGEMSVFAETIIRNKYAHTKENGNKEDWSDISTRVPTAVMSPYLPEVVPHVKRAVLARKFMPGGRYLYAAGRRFPQTQNCFLFDLEDTREEWASLMSRSTNSLMTGGGIGCVYSKLRPEGSRVGGLGGLSTGPVALMQMVNEAGRHIMQGGARRCLPVGSLVSTKRGLLPIESVAVGDEVVTADGYRKVLGVVAQGKQGTVRVQTQVGDFVCTPNHRMAVLANTAGAYKWVEAGALGEEHRLVFIRHVVPGVKTALPAYTPEAKSKHSSTCVDICVPKLDAEIAWFLGFFHGNGSVTRIFAKGSYCKGVVTVCGADWKLQAKQRCVQALKRFGVNARAGRGDGACWSIRVSSKQLAHYLENFKQSRTSISIPDCVLQAVPEIRAAYLAGIVDSDGCFSRRSNLLCSSVYPDFCRQLQALAASLGFAARVRLNREAAGAWQALYNVAVSDTSHLQALVEHCAPHSVCFSAEMRIAALRAAESRSSQRTFSMPAALITADNAWRRTGRNSSNRVDVPSDIWAKANGTSSKVPVKVLGVIPGFEVETYDLQVEDRAEFVCGGLLVHNSAIWAGLHWNHQDACKLITTKNWHPDLVAMKLKDFNAAAPLDMTNISIILDDLFFNAFDDSLHVDHALAHAIYWQVVAQMCETGEPGFSIDIGKNAGEHLRNAPVVGATYVLTNEGYRQVSALVGAPTTVWTGKQWAKNVTFRLTQRAAPTVLVRMTGGRSLCCEPTHEFLVERWVGAGQQRKLKAIDRIAAKDLHAGHILHVSMPAAVPPAALDTEAYSLGFIYGDGTFSNKGRSADVAICSKDKLPCLDVMRGSNRLSSVGAGGRTSYARAYFKSDPQYFSGRTKEDFPDDMYSAKPAVLCSFLAGLFDADGNWEPGQHRVRLSLNSKKFLRGAGRALEQLGIQAGVSKNGHSTFGQKQCYQLVVTGDYVAKFAQLIPTKRLKVDVAGYQAYRRATIKVLDVTPAEHEDVYCCDVGVDEHSFMAEGVIISNCTEIVSRDNNDVCNLGSLNLARIKSKDELADLIWYAMAFQLCGSMYSTLPIKEMYDVRNKNRRIGMGLMGVAEWLLVRGKKYGPDPELSEWLEVYRDVSDQAAIYWADKLGVTRPIARRAIAPTGTIAIAAETTSAFEPIFAVATKRRYLTGKTWKAQYTVDVAAQRLIDRGVDPAVIEDAYDLAENVERRIEFQAYIQRYVDMGCSSTINLPQWGSSTNNSSTVKNFGEKLYKHLRGLRGITAYPDGARGGQPLNKVPYAVAKKYIGVEIEEGGETCHTDVTEAGNERGCINGVCGL